MLLLHRHRTMLQRSILLLGPEMASILPSGLLHPLMAAGQPQAPPELRQALDTLNRHVDDYISRARLGKAA
jgi:hypothetical protein